MIEPCFYNLSGDTSVFILSYFFNWVFFFAMSMSVCRRMFARGMASNVGTEINFLIFFSFYFLKNSSIFRFAYLLGVKSRHCLLIIGSRSKCISLNDCDFTSFYSVLSGEDALLLERWLLVVGCSIWLRNSLAFNLPMFSLIIRVWMSSLNCFLSFFAPQHVSLI